MSENRFHAFQAPESFWRVASVSEYALVADLGWIRHKHPKEFPTDKALITFIENVIGSPDLNKIPGTSKNAFLFFIVLSGQCAVIEMTAFKLASGEKAYRINTAFTLQPRPLAKAILALEKNSGLDANPDSGGSDPKAAHPGTPSQSFEEASRCIDIISPDLKKKSPVNP